MSLLRPVRRGRLLADIDVFELDLRRRVGNGANCADLHEEWAREACQLLALARVALGRFDTERAWAHLDAARRATIPGFGVDELHNAAVALKKESTEKVGSWRGETIEALLADWAAPEQPRSDPSLAPLQLALRDATLIRDEHLRNNYRKVALLRRRLAILMVFLIATAGTLVALQAWLPVRLDAEPADGGGRIWAYVVAWGVLGGSFTAVLSVIGNSLKSRLPEQLREGVITSIRPLFGAAGALAAFVLVQAGAFGIDVSSNAGVFTVSFAAGFSETLIVRAMGAAADRASSAGG